MSGARLHLRVVSPERLVLETDADRVALPGALGQLGILPGHAALITALRTGVLEIRSGGSVQRVAVFGGFAEVREDAVTVLADGAVLAEEIDRAAVLAELAAAEAALATTTPETLSAVRARLETAEARLAVIRS
ncbi:MAG: ATP synthase F1 subunit epsilon [Thermoanaerobaculaceae bacterium]|nr:ATP synthase F1 subunit epsilon [Thermoanaerobaculaceae bacterium]MDI9621350.1 ATP synthase F1 subunit epsilon [Acidobacteriota bacterium]NLH11715.1 ATP synthase F1 subunit epsilon [Holophagae bacterium]HPW54118.1 ATP synthase F1 subunit epsilon [Thermoanaerobaculaceae bacterium]